MNKIFIRLENSDTLIDLDKVKIEIIVTDKNNQEITSLDNSVIDDIVQEYLEML